MVDDGAQSRACETQDYPVVYANTAQISTSAYDARIVFALARGNDAPQRPLVEVFLSVEQAKAMSILLSKSLEKWEDATSTTIHVPPAIIETQVVVERKTRRKQGKRHPRTTKKTD